MELIFVSLYIHAKQIYDFFSYYIEYFDTNLEKISIHL